MDEYMIEELLITSGKSEIELVNAGQVGISIDDTRNRAFIYLDVEKARQLHEWLGRYLENCDE